VQRLRLAEHGATSRGDTSLSPFASLDHRIKGNLALDDDQRPDAFRRHRLRRRRQLLRVRDGGS